MRIVVIDGQGGGIGRQVISQLRGALAQAEIIAVGTNAMATASMLKAGASGGATGEHAVIYNAARADVIVGPIGIILCDAMLGEITPAMTQAICRSAAEKILIPVSKCHVRIAGMQDAPTAQYIDQIVALLRAKYA
nr:DUF3842 family protein [Maliibacterium massiliense]